MRGRVFCVVHAAAVRTQRRRSRHPGVPNAMDPTARSATARFNDLMTGAAQRGIDHMPRSLDSTNRDVPRARRACFLAAAARRDAGTSHGLRESNIFVPYLYDAIHPPSRPFQDSLFAAGDHFGLSP